MKLINIINTVCLIVCIFFALVVMAPLHNDGEYNCALTPTEFTEGLRLPQTKVISVPLYIVFLPFNVIGADPPPRADDWKNCSSNIPVWSWFFFVLMVFVWGITLMGKGSMENTEQIVCGGIATVFPLIYLGLVIYMIVLLVNLR